MGKLEQMLTEGREVSWEDIWRGTLAEAFEVEEHLIRILTVTVAVAVAVVVVVVVEAGARAGSMCSLREGKEGRIWEQEWV